MPRSWSHAGRPEPGDRHNRPHAGQMAAAGLRARPAQRTSLLPCLSVATSISSPPVTHDLLVFRSSFFDLLRWSLDASELGVGVQARVAPDREAAAGPWHRHRAAHAAGQRRRSL